MIDFDKMDIIFLIFFAMVFMLIGFLITIIPDTNGKLRIPESEQEIINNCKNLSLEDSAYCLKNEISSFYVYNITDDKFAENMILEKIKEFGTDCGGWAYLYKRLASGLGFKSNTNNYKGLRYIYPGHRWATIWDN